MKKHVIGAALVLTMASTAMTTSSSQHVLSAMDYRIARKQPELIIWYQDPATDWESEALPLGNGFIGGMLFGGVEIDKIQINKNTLWSGGPGANVNYDGGIKGDPAANKETLHRVRQILQEKMSDFSKNHAAFVDKTTGAIISENYSPEDEVLQVQGRLCCL